MLRGLLLLLFTCGVYIALGQSKTLTAVKAQQAPVIDGKLDDSVWNEAAIAQNFIQHSPSFGKDPSAVTKSMFLYDDNAVYIAAYLYDNPALIRKQITARDGDQRQDVDYFSVAFDTYNDQQNGFLFLVTPANVQTDAKIGAGTNITYSEFNRTWDAVWQSSVRQVADGWVVEMRIPYISLRFAKKEVQTWGLQFIRFTRRNNEVSTWNPVNPQESGFINQFGKCQNLLNIQPPLRLSLSPYVTTGVRYYPSNTNTKPEFLRNGGMDVKYGLNESFTLDATLVPDFGQVVSDNLVNNLSPFEIRFQENRPFFTEGTELFNKAGLFYSRRIGATPAGFSAVSSLDTANFRVLKNPSITQLYNAVKLSGRTRNKLGVGFFNAVTAPMKASVFNKASGKESFIETEPLSNYNVLVLDQALGGRSSVTLTNTNVLRNGATRDANVAGLDYSYYTKNNQYQFKVLGRYSSVFGYSPYNAGNINLVNDTVRVNGRLVVKPYNGFKTDAYFGKISGKIQYDANVSIESNRYDPTDLGFLQAPNKVNYFGELSYNQQTPTDKFISYSYTVGLQHFSLYKPSRFTSFEVYATGFWIFKNFWDVRVAAGSQPTGTNDFFELRTPNKFLKRPAFHYFGVEGSTDSRKKYFVSYNTGYTRTEVEDGNYYSLQISNRYRFTKRFTLSLAVNHQNDANQIGFAFVREPGTREPVLGYRKFLETESILSGIYNFTSRLNLTLRARHYWNEVSYKKFFTAADNGKPVPRAFINDLDENYNLFNLDAFLTWDFRLGSRVIVGYKNWLGDPYGVTKQSNYFGNLKNIFGTDHGNELTVKLIYFLDYNQLRGKR